MATLFKDPNATLDYSVDWSAWLPTGDTISQSAWTVPAGLTKGAESVGTGVATVWLSGGTVGTRYGIVNRITTAAGRIDDRTLTLVVQER